MLIAGCAWGVYSLRGRRSVNALADNAGNFARSVPGTLLISVLLWSHRAADTQGIVLAVLSGSIASGLGYCRLVCGAAQAGGHRGRQCAAQCAGDRRSRGGSSCLPSPLLCGLPSPLCWCSAGTALAVRRTLTFKTARVASDR